MFVCGPWTEKIFFLLALVVPRRKPEMNSYWSHVEDMTTYKGMFLKQGALFCRKRLIWSLADTGGWVGG